MIFTILLIWKVTPFKDRVAKDNVSIFFTLVSAEKHLLFLLFFILSFQLKF